MIALKKLACPTSLNQELVKELTEKYKNDGTSVWKRTDISNQLLASSHSKCIYCECLQNEESKYMEIDHFRHKDEFPDQVIEWENLVPSCKKCNTSKGTHNTQTTPIINPFEIEPRKHLDFKAYRFIGKSDLGNATVDVTNLNDYSHRTKPRFQIGEQIFKNIENLIERLSNALDTKNTDRQNVTRSNKLKSCVGALLMECQPEAAYSATVATILFDHPDWADIVVKLQKHKYWDDELQTKLEAAQSISYV